MGSSGTLASEVALAALYLRGGPPRGPLRRARWPLVRDALLRLAPALTDMAAALRDCGLWEESTVLAEPGRTDWALPVVEEGRALTAASPDYPERWVRALGASAPAALWVRGRAPTGETVSIAGSREPDPEDVSFVTETATTALTLGLSVVSGGARGIDSAAARAASNVSEGRTVAVYPCGLDLVEPDAAVCQLSLCEPWAGFSPAQAMERNTLIYAASPLTVVVRPRYRTGGTWAGAVDSMRRRTSQSAVWGPDGDDATEALVRLGAYRIMDANELEGLREAAVARERGSAPVLDGL
ncbi:MAG: DNA-processing protein DprA [Armatimonadetes bacterium]|nr:DNA-processing protein DprA [Armatimonadota bacterium]